jgi:hypothetical protein
MTFVLRGLAVSFATFVIAYIALSALLGRAWKVAPQQCRSLSANLLLSLRLAPLCAAALITFGVAVPSFVLFEPRNAEEPFGPPLVFVCVIGMIGLIAVLAKLISTLRSTTRTVARWSDSSQPANVGGDQASVCIRVSRTVPTLATAGIWRSTIWLSDSVRFVLTDKELRIALRHEQAHVRQRDNLKKLALRLVSFPGMRKLDEFWQDAIEMEADDAAVSNVSEALDLASAVIKVSALPSLRPTAQLITGLITSTKGAIDGRVLRLINWRERQRRREVSALHWTVGACAFATFCLVASDYYQLLVKMHSAAEWLVR